MELSAATITAICLSGEIVTFVPSIGATVPVMALVIRKGNSPMAEQGHLAANQVSVFLGRDKVTTLSKVADKFRLKPWPHLTVRDYIIKEIASGDNWWSLILE